jgi:hypothetical protein
VTHDNIDSLDRRFNTLRFNRPNDVLLRVKSVRTSLLNIAQRGDARSVRDELEAAQRFVEVALRKLEAEAEAEPEPEAIPSA